MKIQIVLVTLGVSLVSADENSNPASFPAMPDPRPPIYRTFSVGEEAQQTLSESIIVIAWAHPPKGTKKTGYQIWGDARILTKEQISLSLRALCQATDEWAYQPHLLVIGNGWGVGRELDPLMKELSKAHKIDTYYYGASYLFREVAFKEEKEHRRKQIIAAVDTGKKRSEQEGADQPATAPESKPEGQEKPKPESEGRSR